MAGHFSLCRVSLFVVSVFVINGVNAELTNVAINKTVTTSDLFEYGPVWEDLDNIVDGDLRTDGNPCACCAATALVTDPWIMVDLEQEYWIEKVVVYGRTDELIHQPQSMLGLQLHVANSAGLQGSGIYTVEGTGWIGFVSVTLEKQLKSRFVTLLLKGKSRQLTVCELEVYSPESMLGLQLHVANSAGLQGSGIYTVEGTGWIGFVSVTLEKQLKSRFVTLLLKGKSRQLTVCELEVYSPACKPGTFGQDCSSVCGMCYDNAPCDTVTGACDQCMVGFDGVTCSTACKPGTFGQDCSSVCGMCYDNVPCDTVTGACGQCMAGFKGVTCSTACENGSYGSNCRLSCGHCYGDQPCNKVDGTCDRCDRGYLGDLCVTECKAGTYGQDCSTLCGFCLKYETCNHVTGHCSKGCAAGRQGDTCKQACGNYTFGVNCKQQCHCSDDKSCDSINGECGDGLCAEGFFGAGCQQIKGDPDDRYQGLIIGVVISVACIVIAVVVAGVYFLKRRKRSNNSSEMVQKPTEENPYEDLHVNKSQL